MIDLLLPLGDGHTWLSEDDRRGLRPAYVTTRGELNAAEQANILRAVGRARRPSARQLLDDLYLRRLHGRMFGEVWSWAGAYRRVDTNIGIGWERIAVATRDLVEDALAWTAAMSEPADVVAARFHHRLVQIHPFPNGNGRHGRVAADYLVRALGEPRFTWGAAGDLDDAALRAAYIAALHAADAGDLAPLVAFARS